MSAARRVSASSASRGRLPTGWRRRRCPPPSRCSVSGPGRIQAADYELLVKYFRALDSASEGCASWRSAHRGGRTMIAAVITSGTNQRRLDRLGRSAGTGPRRAASTSRRRARWPRRGRASRVDRLGPARERGGHRSARAELAFRVATEDTEEMRRIRDEVVLCSAGVNPDGMDRVGRGIAAHSARPRSRTHGRPIPSTSATITTGLDIFQMPESRNGARRALRASGSPDRLQPSSDGALPARIFVRPSPTP